MESEMKIFEMMNKKAGMSKYWMPLVWATNIINRARKEALITSDHVVQTLLVELSDIRKRLGALIGYDTVCVPLVYTQVSSREIRRIRIDAPICLTCPRARYCRNYNQCAIRLEFASVIRVTSFCEAF